MSLFYLKNEPHIRIVAPIDGEVLSCEETDIPEDREGLSILPSSDTLLSPINGTVTNVSDDLGSYTITGAEGERIIFRIGNTILSPIPTPGQQITVGDPLLYIDNSDKLPGGHSPVITLILDNSDKYRSITVFEGKCRALQTEIMSFCK